MKQSLASVFGFIPGFGRRAKNKPIDFRVYMIVATIACFAIIMGLMLGFGQYGLALLGFVLVAVILTRFGYFRQLLSHEKEKNERRPRSAK